MSLTTTSGRSRGRTAGCPLRSSTPPWSFLESTSGPRQVELYPCPAFWRQGLLRMLKRLVGQSTPRVVPLRERPRVIYITIMCFAVHLKRLLCFLFAQADLTCTCGFRHLTPKLACSLLHRSAYSQGSLDICNPCRRRHLALLSSVASRWM